MKRNLKLPLAGALVVGLMLATAFVVAAAPPAQDATQAPKTDIGVVGTGRVFAKPDTAIASIGVDVTAPTLEAALTDANARANKVVEAIKAQGVDPKDIQTSTYNIFPVTSQPKEGETAQIVGYRVMYQYNVKVRNLDNLGKVMDAAIAAGANSVNGITFTVDDTATLETAARTAAVKDAQAKAATLAESAGVKVGKIISITEQSGNVQPLYRDAYAPAAQAAGGGAPIETGQNEITVNVEMHFEIVQ